MVPVRAGGRHVGGGRRVSGNHRQRGGLSVTEATLTITDDDTDDGNPPDDGGGNDDGDTRLPDLYIRDATVNEGDDARFAVRLSESSDRLVTVAYETVDRTAVAGSDYTSTSGLVRFEAGETSKTIAVPTIEDATVEETEGFTVQLSDPAGATVADGTALGTTTDDDDPPGLSIDDAPAVREGETAEFVVRLSASSGVAATVSYRTFDGTALAGFDYVAAEGTLRFEPGETTHTVAVATLTDDLVEGPKDSPSSWAIRLGRRWPTAPLRAQSPTTRSSASGWSTTSCCRR